MEEPSAIGPSAPSTAPFCIGDAPMSGIPDFHPKTVLIDWKDKDGRGFTIGDALAGCCVMGGTGSGKTSGPGTLLALSYLEAGFGGLVLCAKKDERRHFEELARLAG